MMGDPEPAPAEEAQAAEPAAESDGWEWAILEVFGHRKHAGRIREEERFGAKMIRIDIPRMSADTTAIEGWTTHYYGGSSIFSLTLTDEKTVRLASIRSLTISSPHRLSYDRDDDVWEGDY